MSSSRRQLNIEQVFVALRRAWHPPSAAIESSFTVHTRTLAGIFSAMREDEDLAFLHSQIYRELPGMPELPPEREEPSETDPSATETPVARRRFRKGFYLCNSLIQLMEDVYLGLKLAEDYAHPDNRGWMNLFRHWSRSDMFRQTWAVSACTYGLRFQDFCRRHLQLELGWTEIDPVWDRVTDPDHELPAEAMRALEVAETQMVQHLLRHNVRGLENPIAARIDKVVAGQLVVPSAEMVERIGVAGRSLSFEERQALKPITYGVAVLDQRGHLVTLRVRRHLRSRGLGRQLIHGLISRLGVGDTAQPDPAELSRVGLSSRSLGRIENLFKSVLNEVELERSRLGMVGETELAAVLAPIPEMPYTGVIRPLEATWAHALGLIYWWVAWRPDLELSRDESEELGRALRSWLGLRVEPGETGVLARESLQWLTRSKHLEQAVERDLVWIAATLARQPWFSQLRVAFVKDLLRIAKADGKVTGREERVVRRIVEPLGLSQAERNRLGLPATPADGDR